MQKTYSSLLVLGRQPALGLAELESLFGSDKVRPFAACAFVDVSATDIPFHRLGGSTRACKVLTPLANNWPAIRKHLIENVPTHAAMLPEGKLTIGVSVLGLNVHSKELERVLLELKKAIKKSGRPVRIVPNKELELNSAQVIHNKLTQPGNWELLIVSDGRQTYLAQTVHIQDIASYTERDRGRPYRDARVGMLPPKLAQIIINLASATVRGRMLDPFCGTGVTLQEGTLMGYDVYGSDIEPRMVDYSIGNLHWLREKYSEKVGEYVRIELGDATKHKWEQPIDMVAGETYLGAPLTNLPKPDALRQIINNTNGIHEKFLRNLAPQLTSGTRLCLAVPAWSVVSDAFVRLPVLDHLKELGYNEVKFVHAKKHELVYHRENQFVARELVVITKE